MPFQKITTYLVLVNAAAFILMLTDKLRAKRCAWRIPESTLLGVALAGGAFGSIIGMYLVRHKTKHPKFFIGLPLIFLFQIAIMIMLITK